MIARIFTIITREYVTRVRTKGFIIGTLIFPVMIAFFTFLPMFLARHSGETTRQIAVADFTGSYFSELENGLDHKNNEGERVYDLVAYPTEGATPADLKRQLGVLVEEDAFAGYIVIEEDVLDSNKAEYYTKNVSNFRDNRRIGGAITSAITRQRLQSAGLDGARIKDLTRRVDLKIYKVGPEGAAKEDQGQTWAVSYVLGFMLYITLLLYSITVMRSVIEEKTTRIVEVILSSVKPFELMMGKILGVCAVGLTQYAVWGVLAGGVILFGKTVMPAAAQGASTPFTMPSIPPQIFLFLFVFYLLGYILFSTLYAAVGAMVNSEDEAQQLQFPVAMLLIIPFMLQFAIINDPNGSLARILSFVPFFTPILMFMRITILTPPLSEIFASILVLVLTIVVMVWLVGKIYRVGILMYGKRPTLPELIRWIRYS